MFYCLCYVNGISTDMLWENLLKERDPDLNEENDTRMIDSKEEHWSHVSEDVEDKSYIHSLG